MIRPRALTLGRTLRKGVYGALVRGAQALVLLAGILLLSEESQSDLAVAITLVGLLNLITNFGLPTLLVRHAALKERGETSAIGSLLAAYLGITAAGVLVVVAVGLALFESAPIALGVAVMFVGVSVLSGLEYWASAFDRYDAYLGGPARIHVALALLAGPVTALTRSAEAGLLLLGASYLLPLLTAFGRSSLRQITSTIAQRVRPANQAWLRDAGTIAAATAGAACLYGADVFVIRFSDMLGEDAEYRLAVQFVGLVVGLAPAGFFMLVDSARERPVEWSRHLGVLIGAVAGLATLGGALLVVVPGPISDVGALLVFMGPLAGIRVATQAAAASEHGRGQHARVAVRFWIAAIAFVAISWLALAKIGLYGMLAAQTLIELMLLVTMLSVEGLRYQSPRITE